MRLALFLCSALLAAGAPLLAANAGTPGYDVTVLLFRTEQVQHLHVESRGATLQRCPACPRQQGPVSFDLQRQGSAMLDGAHRALYAVTIEGEATIETAAHHRAIAAGRWTIDVDQDRLRVRVQVPRERYVEAVLDAEADPAEPIESLKALAIVTRSFAAAGRGRHEGDALCDTTHCQALRLEPVRQTVRDAVWSTSGETLWYGSRQVPAYFSQHCGGYTEAAASVWGGGAAPWLSAHADPWCFRVPSRWHAALLESDVRRALASEDIVLPGAIEEVVPVARDASGRIQQLRLRIAGGTRIVAAPVLRLAVDRSLGWNQIRSDRYQVQRVGERLVFDGSGFGHGVGLCQAGATVMARAGKTEREILQMYFPGTTVRVQKSDAGWSLFSANGFALRTTGHDEALQRDAAAAFADAQARWGRPARVVPMLTVFPTVEAFRQATGQPGWTLAVTTGDRIATDSADILNSHGGTRPIFRHEFLHSFVEAEASPKSPLWLREGAVAVLNGEPCVQAPARSPEEVSAALRNPGSLEQSQQAHRAACALTQRYLREHGWTAVHALLQQP